MNKKLNMLIGIILAVSIPVSAETNEIGLVINSDLYPLIEDVLNTYISELEYIQGIKTVWVENSFGAESNNYSELWEAIKEQYETKEMDGVIFIGDLPVVDCGSGKYNPDPQCDLYWMDMDDGSFSGSGPEFNSYSGSGPEIWMTRVTTSYFENEIDKSEDEIVKEYFGNVSERMRGGLIDEDTSMFIMGDDGVSYWDGIDDEHEDEMYYENVEIYLETRGENDGNVWKDGLNEGHEYFMVFNHSSHSMHQTDPRCNIRDLYTSERNIRFGQMFACLNSRLDYPNMVAAYGLLNGGLGCNGAGKSGSIKPDHYHFFNDPLNEDGNLFGDALKEWWQDDGIETMDWASANVMEGVGTLKLKPYNDATKISRKGEGINAPQVKFRQTVSHASIFVPFNSRTEIVITNLLGKKIMSLKTGKSAWHTLPAKLAQGVHLARVTNQKQKTVYKFDVVR